MTTHPNRGKDPFRAGRTPRPAEIIAARAAADLTQLAAARTIHCSLNTWQKWEAGDRTMHPAFWELFHTKTRGGAQAAAAEPQTGGAR